MEFITRNKNIFQISLERFGKRVIFVKFLELTFGRGLTWSSRMHSTSAASLAV